MGYKLDPKTGTYIVWYGKRHPITRIPTNRRRIGIKSKALAKQMEQKLILEVHKLLERKTIPIWKQAIEEFYKYFLDQDVSVKTAECYFLCLKAHTNQEWGVRLVSEISGADIRNLIKEKLSHRSQSHQKNVLKYIRAVMNFCVEKRYITTNPTPRMKFRVGDKIKTVLKEDQIKVLLSHAKEMNSEWYPIWATALYTGMRNGELYALSWENIDLVNRKILVNISWNNKDGFKSTKSGDDRILEIAPPLVDIFKTLKKDYPESSFVLPRIDRWDRGDQARELRMFLEGLGLPRIRFHDLRASWATIMLSKGIPPIKVMMMGGWKDLKTMQYYVRKAGVSIKGITDHLNFNLEE
ncbi:site-specific integrase [Bacteriovoracaceae bacterium]|nr:site-specific integrase [Bacteriovoracaceae bacterium]